MKLNRYIRQPWLIPIALQNKGLGIVIPDSVFLRSAYYSSFGNKLNLKEPKTFNEKLQWLKLNDRKMIYTTMVDKYAVKEYVANIIGEKYVIPTFGVWNKFDEIDFSTLPRTFVLKCTHDSGGVVICKDQSNFDLKKARKKLTENLHKDYYLNGREWPYRNVKHRIIAEQYIDDNLQDYKIFCFNGKPRMTLVCSDRFTKNGLKEDFYDENWNHLELQRPAHGNTDHEIKCPCQYELMKELAAKLAENIPFVRIDFYEHKNRVYFGEMTFYPASGFEGFNPSEWDEKLGEWIKLPK